MKTTSTAPLADCGALARSPWMAVVCFVVLCITLTLGLWPFHPPFNQVSWLRDRNGVNYGRSATLWTSVDFPANAIQRPDAGHTIEVWVQPYPYLKSATLFTFYQPQNPLQFQVRQDGADLWLQVQPRNKLGRALAADLYVPEVFHGARSVFITIASGRQGTTVYADGKPVVHDGEFLIPDSFWTGRLILGDSPLQPDSWRGQFLGLAIYQAELNSAQTLRHYHTWMESGTPEGAGDEQNIALYLFNEHAGNMVHNQAKPGVDLYIPQKYEVISKAFMEPFWNEFQMTRSYWSGVYKNLIGFVPFGFCFYTYLLARQLKRAALLTIALGTVVSLTIEVLQCFLPTRDSGTTDILTNTLGTWGGVLLHRFVSPVLARRFPSLAIPNRS